MEAGHAVGHAGEKRTRVVVLGMGYAGLEAVRELTMQTKHPMDISIISPDTHFVVGLSQAFLMLGALEKMDIAIPAESARCFLPHDEGGPPACHQVRRIRDYAIFVDWRQQKVLLRGGGSGVEYDYLVVATGTRCVRSNIPGQVGNSFDICNPDDNEMLSSALESLAASAGPHSRKRVVVAVTSLPYRCPVAPMEWAMLIDARLRAHSVREHVDIVYVGPEPQLLPLAGAVGNLFLSEVLRRRSIQVQCGATVTAVSDARIYASQNYNKPVTATSASHPSAAGAAEFSPPLPQGSKLVELELEPTPAFVKPGVLETREWPSIPVPSGNVDDARPSARRRSFRQAAIANPATLDTRTPPLLFESRSSSTPGAGNQSPKRRGTRVLAGVDILVTTSLLVAPDCVTRSFPTSEEHGNSRFLPACRVSQATQYPRVFAAGDVAEIRLQCPGFGKVAPVHPKTGHFAKQMAQLAATNILADVEAGGAFSRGLELPSKGAADLAANTDPLVSGASSGLESLAAAAAAFAAAGRGGSLGTGDVVAPRSAAIQPRVAIPTLPRMVIAQADSSVPCSTASQMAASTTRGKDMKDMPPGWWWSGKRGPLVRWGVCAFQTDGVRAVAVRANIPLSDGPAIAPVSRPESPTSAIAAVEGGPGDACSEASEALALAVASSTAASERSDVNLYGSGSASTPRYGTASAALPAGSSASVGSRAPHLAAAASATQDDARHRPGRDVAVDSPNPPAEAHELSFSFNLPSEAAMEYLLLFWRAHLHRWFHIPADICPPHLEMTIPAFLAHRLSDVGSGRSSATARATPASTSSASSAVSTASLHRDTVSMAALGDLADSAADEATWAALKEEIDLEHKHGRAGDPTAVLVGPLLQSVARQSRVTDTARAQLLSAVASGFGLSQRGGLTTAQALAHGVPLTAIAPASRIDPCRTSVASVNLAGSASAVCQLDTPLSASVASSARGSVAHSAKSGHTDKRTRQSCETAASAKRLAPPLA